MKPVVIDISHHQPDPIDFAKVKASGVLGVIIKASEGTSYRDPSRTVRAAAARKAGLLVGFYHFANASDVEKQVAWFMAAADPGPGDLLALDFEDNTASQMTVTAARTFMRLVEQMSARSPVLYSGNTIKDKLGHANDLELGKYRFWLAEYGPKPVTQASWPKGPWLWQFSGSGACEGVKGAVDLNAYTGGGDMLSEWSGSKTSAAPIVIVPAKPVQPLPDDPGPMGPAPTPSPSKAPLVVFGLAIIGALAGVGHFVFNLF